MSAKRISVAMLLMTTAAAYAEEVRDLDAHEHGSGALNIAIEGATLAMELEVPGADIVGFEYTAESASDRALVDAAISDLARPLDHFVMPADAECTVTAANVALIGEEDHHDHDHDEHAEADEHGHDDHDHEETAEADEHGHDDHGHEETADAEAQHNEFHAEYTLTCANPQAIDRIEFAYFDRFENALELEVQIVSDAGAQAFEVERDDPVLDMRGMF